MERLEDELSHAMRFGTEISAPGNESNTCEWVILPLLWALGYQRYEIASRSSDAAGKYPDYTILPGTEFTWYLEAKAWNENLSSLHVDQSLNYAHSNGRRWVVLTNGREWQLYDDAIPGISAQRLVVTAMLSDAEALRAFLVAISKESIRSGKIVAYANSQRMHRALGDQLGRPDSELVRAIVSTLRTKLGVPSATASDLVSYFSNQTRESPVSTAPLQAAPAPAANTMSVHEAEASTPYASTPKGETMCLITPVKSEGGRSAEEIIRALLGSGWYVFADHTAGRKRLKPSDKICFYIGKKGVVAEATVASVAELGEVPGVKHPEKYRWRFRVRDVRYFFDSPVPIDVGLRLRLDAFKGKDAESTSWSWFIQGTGIVSVHDFLALTGRDR